MYTDPFSDQQKIRTALIEHMIKSGIGLKKVSSAIGIAHTTVTSFTSKGKNVQPRSLGRIIKYLESL